MTKLGPQGAWVGYPVLLLRLSTGATEILDGSKRLAEWKARFGDKPYPSVTVTSYVDGIRNLANAGHYERAVILAERGGVQFVDSISDLVKVCQLPYFRAQNVVRAWKKKSGIFQHPRRAMHVVRRLLALKEKMQMGQQASLRDISEVLGAFDK